MVKPHTDWSTLQANFVHSIRDSQKPMDSVKSHLARSRSPLKRYHLPALCIYVMTVLCASSSLPHPLVFPLDQSNSLIGYILPNPPSPEDYSFLGKYLLRSRPPPSPHLLLFAQNGIVAIRVITTSATIIVVPISNTRDAISGILSCSRRV